MIPCVMSRNWVWIAPPLMEKKRKDSLKIRENQRLLPIVDISSIRDTDYGGGHFSFLIFLFKNS